MPGFLAHAFKALRSRVRPGFSSPRRLALCGGLPTWLQFETTAYSISEKCPFTLRRFPTGRLLNLRLIYIPKYIILRGRAGEAGLISV
jgi:hypothetical protein